MLKYSHPWLALLLHHWPAAILLPTIFLLIAVLAMITRRWDRRTAAQSVATGRRAPQGARATRG